MELDKQIILSNRNVLVENMDYNILYNSNGKSKMCPFSQSVSANGVLMGIPNTPCGSWCPLFSFEQVAIIPNNKELHEDDTIITIHCGAQSKCHSAWHDKLEYIETEKEETEETDDEQ